MHTFDLIIRDGNIVTRDGVRPADLGVAEEKIVAIEPRLSASAREEINAAGLHIFPGVIDSHVHFNEPGRTEWEGIATGSRALAAGGGTLFFDMPLNAHPPTCDAESFNLKLAAAQRSSVTDFAFWGGLVPGNLDRLEELADCGVVGFKAFMANSGIEDFARADDTTLREGMTIAARLNKLVAVHAESETMTRELATGFIARGQTSIRDYLDSRPVASEIEAISQAIELAGETGCALHVVHVSTGEGVALICEARKRGVDVTCETCPHYLLLTEADMEQLGAVAKCAPPLRPPADQELLWEHLLSGSIRTIGSDHSPAPPEMKRDASFFKVWGGISGVQHTLPLLLTGFGERAQSHRLSDTDSLALISNLLSTNVARRFRIPGKGELCIGCDADFALVGLREEQNVTLDGLLYRHKQSPYVGLKLTGRVVRTILRGKTIFKDGSIVGNPTGRLATSTPNS